MGEAHCLVFTDFFHNKRCPLSSAGSGMIRHTMSLSNMNSTLQIEPRRQEQIAAMSEQATTQSSYSIISTPNDVAGSSKSNMDENPVCIVGMGIDPQSLLHVALSLKYTMLRLSSSWGRSIAFRSLEFPRQETECSVGCPKQPV